MTSYEAGCQYMDVSSTTAVWPSDNQGAVTATAANSMLLKAQRVILVGARLLTTPGGTGLSLTILKQDGTTTLRTITIASSDLPEKIYCFGSGNRGLEIGPTGSTAGISAKVSTAGLSLELCYRALGSG